MMFLWILTSVNLLVSLSVYTLVHKNNEYLRLLVWDLVQRERTAASESEADTPT
jgi:hypothetical protein